jgi:hypothetical protein
MRFENQIKLRVAWYHNQNNRRISRNKTNPMKYAFERFVPEYDLQTHSPLVDEINSPTVLHVFKKLNKGGFIPISIINKIEKTLKIKFIRPTKRSKHIDEDEMNFDENDENTIVQGAEEKENEKSTTEDEYSTDD